MDVPALHDAPGALEFHPLQAVPVIQPMATNTEPAINHPPYIISSSQDRIVMGNE